MPCKKLPLLVLVFLLSACGTRGALERVPGQAPEPLLGQHRPVLSVPDANTTDKDRSQ